MQIIELKESIIADNDRDAEVLRSELKDAGIYYVNVMSSPGSGKTTTLLQTLERMKHFCSVGVMEADIDSDVDAKTIEEAGISAVQLHTGGMCHLDADMSRQGMRALKEASAGKDNELIFLENVGNLVCPAEFDTGAQLNVVILSVPEGDDKPLKYPLMFETCDIVLINKIDAMPAFDFSLERVTDNIHHRNPEAMIFPISAKDGDGVDAWCEELKKRISEWRAQ